MLDARKVHYNVETTFTTIIVAINQDVNFHVHFHLVCMNLATVHTKLDDIVQLYC